MSSSISEPPTKYPPVVQSHLERLTDKLHECFSFIHELDEQTNNNSLSREALLAKLHHLTKSTTQITEIALNLLENPEYSCAKDEFILGAKQIQFIGLSAVATHCLKDLSKRSELLGKYWEKCGKICDGDPKWAETHIHEHPQKLLSILSATIDKTFGTPKVAKKTPPKTPPKPGAASRGGSAKAAAAPHTPLHPSADLKTIGEKATDGYAEAKKANPLHPPIGIANPLATCFVNASAQFLLHTFAGKLDTLPETHFRNVLMAMERGMLPKAGVHLPAAVSHRLRQAIRNDGMTAAASGTSFHSAVASMEVQCSIVTVMDKVLSGYTTEKPVAIQGTYRTIRGGPYDGEIAVDEHGNKIIDETPIHSIVLDPLLIPGDLSERSLEEWILEDNPEHYPIRKFLNAPQSFVVRPSYDGGEDLGAAFMTFPMNRTLTTDDGEKEKTSNYTIDAFTQHRGASEAGGHYVAYVKKGTQWYEINDAKTTRIAESVAEAALVPSESRRPAVIHYKKTS